MKKILALILALMMLLGLLPTVAWAEGETPFSYNGIEIYTGMNDGVPGYSNWQELDGLATETNGGGGTSIAVTYYPGNDTRVFLKPSVKTVSVSLGGEFQEYATITSMMTKANEAIYELLLNKQANGNGNVYVSFKPASGSDIELDIMFHSDNGGQGGQQGGFEDCGDSITGYELRDDGRRCLINGIDTNKNNNRPVELGVGWRGSLGDVETIGISAGQVQAMATAGRGATIYGGRGITLELNDAILDDMAGKMTATSDMLWVRTDYRNTDIYNGKATAFRFQLLLNDTLYTAPDGKNIRAYVDVEASATDWVVYCPNEINSELVLQSNIKVAHDFGVGRNEDMTRCTISVKQGGMYVVAPADYSVQGSWPWPGAGSVVWTPGGTKPANAEGVLKALYDNGDNGYLCPVLDNDVHFRFPSQLKRWTEGCGDDWDYDWRFDDTTGVVTIRVNGANQERWRAAVEAQSYGFLTDGVYYNFYFGNQQDEKPRTYGSDYYSDYADGELPGVNAGLYSDYHPNNAYKLAAVNKESKAYKLTGREGTESVLCVLAMDNEQKTMNTAELRYAMRIDLVTVDSFNYKVASANTVAAAKERIRVDNFCMDKDGNGWEARVPEDGTVFLRTNKTSVTMNGAPTRQYDYVADLTVDAPGEGYQLVQWRESYNGSSGSSFPVHLKNTYGGDQTVFITWRNEGTGDVIEEEVQVETMNHATWMELLADEDTPVLTPAAVADASTLALLEENGIYVSYDPDLGYFSTTVDASKLKDVSLLERGVTLTVPDAFKDTAVSFKTWGSGGSENPATHEQDRAQQTKDGLADVDPIPLDSEGAALLFHPFVRTQTLKLDGLTVFYTDFQLYDGLLVQWLDKDSKVLGYSYIYGRNGDFNTDVPTECLTEAPTEPVEKPTLVGEGLEFYCEKAPQTGGDGDRQFFRFSVDDSGKLDSEHGNEVYLPYAYFGITKEEGLQRAQDGKHPTISHYTDTYEISETIIGEYTEQGIKFVTKSFSPFVVDVSDSVVTPETPANIVYTVDENGVAQISSIDLNTNSGKTENIIELPEAESVVIAKAQFAKLAQDNKPAQLLLPVPGDGEPIAITLNSNMLSALASDSNVRLSVISGAVDGNTEQQITAMERLPEAALVLNIDLAVGDVPVTTFAAGAAMQIETYYELPGGYDTVKVYCLKADGTKEPVSAQYSASTGKLVLSLPHLSTYVVEPVKTIVPQGGHSGYITTGHTITSDLKSVSRVTVDGVTVDSKYYTVSGGNVTLSETYLKTLTNGKHTVKLENDSYIATGEITVNNPAGVASAKTGDVGVVLYVGISLAAVLGSAAVIGTRKKEN